MPERLFVSVTFNPTRSYVAVHPELPPVVALSLDGIPAQDREHASARQGARDPTARP